MNRPTFPSVGFLSSLLAFWWALSISIVSQTRLQYLWGIVANYAIRKPDHFLLVTSKTGPCLLPDQGHSHLVTRMSSGGPLLLSTWQRPHPPTTEGPANLATWPRHKLRPSCDPTGVYPAWWAAQNTMQWAMIRILSLPWWTEPRKPLKSKTTCEQPNTFSNDFYLAAIISLAMATN